MGAGVGAGRGAPTHQFDARDAIGRDAGVRLDDDAGAARQRQLELWRRVGELRLQRRQRHAQHGAERATRAHCTAVERQRKHTEPQRNHRFALGRATRALGPERTTKIFALSTGKTNFRFRLAFAFAFDLEAFDFFRFLFDFDFDFSFLYFKVNS